jgi:hypothetical protein
MFSDSDGFPIWRLTLLPNPASEGGVDYLVFPQGSASFQITVAETLQAPSQSATAQTVMPFVVAETVPVPSQSSTIQTVMPVTVAQTVPAPDQSITAEATGEVFQITVDESVPAPSQAGIIDTGTVKPKGAGGPRGAWEYRPPIYTIRTKGSQSVPAPSQSAFARFEPFKEAPPVRVVVKKPVVRCVGGQLILAPEQSGRVKSHRSIKAMHKEEQDILTLLASL